MLYSYSIGFVFVLIGELLFDQLNEAFTFWKENPVKTYGYSFIFSMSGYLGINIVLHLVNQYGALIAVTGESLQKLFLL